MPGQHWNVRISQLIMRLLSRTLSIQWSGKPLSRTSSRSLCQWGLSRLTDLPKGRKRVGSRWVFKVKYTPTGLIDKFKVRLVAKGYGQTYGADYTDTFSPTIKMDSLRALLAIAAANDWPIEQMDASVPTGRCPRR